MIIRLLGQGGAATVCELARHHGCSVVSKDEDFWSNGFVQERHRVRVESTQRQDDQRRAQLLRRDHEDVTRFDEQNEATVLELG